MLKRLDPGILAALFISAVCHLGLFMIGPGRVQRELSGDLTKGRSVRLTLSRRPVIAPISVPIERPVRPDASSETLPVVRRVIGALPAPSRPVSPPVPARPRFEGGGGANSARDDNPEEFSSPAEKPGAVSVAAGRSAPVSASLVAARPLYRQNPPPEYPARARRRRLSGTVVLRVMVGAGGRVRSVSLAESSGHTILDKAAARAVKAWNFLPGRRGGRPVDMEVLVPVRFELR